MIIIIIKLNYYPNPLIIIFEFNKNLIFNLIIMSFINNYFIIPLIMIQF